MRKGIIYKISLRDKFIIGSTLHPEKLQLEIKAGFKAFKKLISFYWYSGIKKSKEGLKSALEFILRVFKK